MNQEHRPEQMDLPGDTSDILEGEIGDAHLKEPDEAEKAAADLEALPIVEPDKPSD